MRNIYFTVLTGTLFSLVMVSNPAMTQAADSNITTVTIDSISATTPSTAADYTVTFDILFGAQSLNLRFYPIADDGTVGTSALSGYNFSNTTLTSDTLPAATLSSVGDDTELAIMLNSTIATGTYTMTLHGVQNSATEGSYQLGLTTTFNATDANFVQSDVFTLAVDPCTEITTVELANVSADTYGTNALITRGDSDPVGTTYTLAYATSQDTIDTDTANTVDLTTDTTSVIQNLTTQTLYYFQVSAIDANQCVLARTTVATTTERAIAQKRYTKPTVNKITRRGAVAHWPDNDYVGTYDLQLWSKTKLLRRFSNLTALKKVLTKQHLRSNHTYKVRVRADFDTGETTRWSKFTKFTTD